MIHLAINIKQVKGSDNLLAQAAFVQNNLNGKISYDNGSLVLSVPLKTLQQDVSQIDFSQADDSTLVIKKYVDDNIAALKGTATTQGDTLGELETAIADIRNNQVTVSATADYNSGIKIGSVTINDDTVEFMINLSDYATLANPSFTGAPTAPTPAAGSDNTLIATTAFVQGVKEALIDSAVSTLDTLGKIAAAINNDPDYYQNVATAMANKVGKGDITITGSSGTGTEIGSIVFNNSTYSFKVDFSPYATLNSPALTGVPTAPTADQGTDTTQIATTAFVNSAVNNVIDGAPSALNTLDKIAAAINDDASFSSTVNTALAGKQPLSTALTSISGLTTAANKMLYTTNTNIYAVTDITAAARNLLDDADAAAMRATLEVPKTDGTGATGTWNITVPNATNAVNAVNDGDGNEISTTYLKINDQIELDLSGYALVSDIKQVTVTNTLSTGTRLGTITVGNNSTDINVNLASYAPLNSPILTGSPTAPTVQDQDDDSTKVATTAFVAGAIRRLMGTTLEGLDTLQELSAAINNDPGFAATLANEMAGKQPLNAALTSISGLTTAADKMIYTTGSNTYAVTSLTEFARSILDDGSAAAVRTTIDALGKSEKAASATVADSASACTGNAATATAATGDKNGDDITTTYVKVAQLHDVEEIKALGWISTSVDKNKIPTNNTLAFWNGCYSNNNSNLAFCNRGAFGDIVTHAATDFLTKAQADSYYMAAGGDIDLDGYVQASDLDDITVTSTNTTGNTIGTITVGSDSIDLKVADISGNAGTATALETSRNIGIKDADGTNTGTGATFNGSADITLKLPSTIKAALTGNASTATKLFNARDINVSDSTGVHTGTAASFDGTANKTIKLPATLDAAITGNAATATALQNAQTIKIANSDGTSATAGTSFKGNAGITLNLPSTIKATLNGNAATATNATNDANGDPIATTYAKTADITNISVTTTNTTGNTIGTVTVGSNSVDLKVADAPTLTTTRTVDGVQFNGDNNVSHYGVCSTAATTAAKAVTISGIKGFTLATGARVTVKFTVANKVSNPTLNVNSTGAKAIYYRGYAIPAAALDANCTYDLVYNGTQWEIVGSVIWTT